MTAADNKYPESVSRICDELQNLSSQMLELRRTQPVFPNAVAAAAAPSGARDDDTAMDVDQDEVLFFLRLYTHKIPASTQTADTHARHFTY
jgi:hypothetical protein